jgi:hypothetical protein
LKVLRIILKEGKGQFWNARKLVADHSEAQTGCPVTYTYNHKTVAKLLKGFTIKESYCDHIFPWRIKDYLNYDYVKILPYRFMPRFMFRIFERFWGWHLCVTAKLA